MTCGSKRYSPYDAQERDQFRTSTALPWLRSGSSRIKILCGSQRRSGCCDGRTPRHNTTEYRDLAVGIEPCHYTEILKPSLGFNAVNRMFRR